MKNISNQEIFTENCTKCPTCGKRSWYVMECDCCHIFCRYCSDIDKDAVGDGSEIDVVYLECPKCGKFEVYA